MIQVEFTKAGNLRDRILKVEPTGEKQSTTFNCRRTLSMKNFQQFSRESNSPAPLTCKRPKNTQITPDKNFWFYLPTKLRKKE